MCRLSVSRKRRPSGQVLKVSRLHPWQQSLGYGKDTDRPQRGVRLDEAMVFVSRRDDEIAVRWLLVGVEQRGYAAFSNVRLHKSCIQNTVS